MSSGMPETLRIATPEGVSLELPLAGLGSRFAALLVDTLLQGVVFIATVILLIVTGAGGFTEWAITAVVAFALIFVYPVAFELCAGGRTPGKRWSSLRVISADGSPVTFRGSALRNLVRLADTLPLFYLAGAVTIFATRSNQRLGDLAAGTLVVREPRAGREAPPVPLPALATDLAELPAWDVSGLHDGDLAVVRRFLAQRDGGAAMPREQVARDLAERLRERLGGVGGDVAPERFLELVAALRSHPGELPAWDVSGLHDADVAALRRFLERREALGDGMRELLARDLAGRLRGRVGGVGGDLPAERFLELVAALRSLRM